MAARAGPLGRHVALLRGINVGGKNRLPMATLASVCTEAGCRDVRTYVQSGNVVFAATAAVARGIPAAITRALADDLGLAIPVVTRTAAELDAVARRNPFLRAGADPETLHIAFLADRPAAAAVAALDPDRSPGDRFVVRGRDVFLHLPNGVARTKLTNAWLDARLDTVSTVRNWQTVLAVRELARTTGSA